MKAKEYFEKYKEALVSNDKDIYVKGCKEMYLEMLGEAQELFKKRHIVQNESAVSVFKEINQKYNAMCHLLEKECGHSVLRQDGFLILCCDDMPFLKPYLKLKEREGK